MNYKKWLCLNCLKIQTLLLKKDSKDWSITIESVSNEFKYITQKGRIHYRKEEILTFYTTYGYLQQLGLTKVEKDVIQKIEDKKKLQKISSTVTIVKYNTFNKN